MNRRKECILIVDDDESILRIFMRILQREGYGVDVAETCQEALDKIGNRIYDLALIDVRLPDRNGLELLNIIHRTRPEMVKIMMTGYYIHEDRARALDSGANDYIAKPIETKKLLEIIKDKLKKQ